MTTEEQHEANIRLMNAILSRLNRIDDSMRSLSNEISLIRQLAQKNEN